jgi:hypothetical protein
MRSFSRRIVFLQACLWLPGAVFALTPISLTQGWNLVGNSDPAAVASMANFSDPAKITSVWKWNKLGSKWAFYTPLMSSTELATYAQSKGYDVLSGIASKEGFWVNATVPLTLTDPTALPPVAGDPVVALTESDLALGWNLLGSADKQTPSQLNAGLRNSLSVINKSITTLWAWDAAATRWRFYAPSLEAQGGAVLTNYIASKSYLPFSAALTISDGFWVNVSAGGGVAVPLPINSVIKVVDGYISGAQVVFDTNDDGVCNAQDTLTTMTDAQGKFSLPNGAQSHMVCASGGVDISTGMPFVGELKAPAGATVVTPLTTLIQASIHAAPAGAKPTWPPQRWRWPVDWA